MVVFRTKGREFLEKFVAYLRKYSSTDHPISGKDLANHFGITDVKVREYVSDARSNGIPICSTRWGYYYSEDRAEIKKTLESLRSRIAAQERAIDGLSLLIAS